MRSIAVTARWDAESRTWWTDGDEIPGLCCQGRTFEELSEAVFALAPDLLVANGEASAGEQVEIVLIAEQSQDGCGCRRINGGAIPRRSDDPRLMQHPSPRAAGLVDHVEERLALLNIDRVESRPQKRPAA